MSLYKKIVEKKEKIVLVGLGYVGMPIAVAFAKKVKHGHHIYPSWFAGYKKRS